MINQQAIVYNPSTRAAGLAAVTFSQYSDFLLLETLVEPVDPAPKSNRSSTKDVPNVKFCKVYPNPTAGILLVEIPAIYEQVLLRIIDGNGKLIYDGRGTQGLNTINLRQVASGNYRLSIYTENGKFDENHAIQIAR